MTRYLRQRAKERRRWQRKYWHQRRGKLTRLAWACPPRGRHPCDKGDWNMLCFKAAVKRMSDHRFWATHPAPFSKTERGMDRRAERRFRIHEKINRPLEEGDIRCTHLR